VSDRFPLTILPTPLLPAPRLGRALGRRDLWVKRDDLTGFVVGGNKARQLERLVGAALAEHADTLVTGGGPGSNFCAAAAAAARVAGMRCLLVMYGQPPVPEPTNLALCRWHGAEVTFTGDPDRTSVDASLVAVEAAQRSAGARPYVMPRGGATRVGATAYYDAGRELAEQLREEGVDTATVLVAAGSGGTAAGLAASAESWRVVAAAVSRSTYETRDQIMRLRDEVAHSLGVTVGCALDVRDARGDGYGVPSAEGDAAMRLAADTEGLLLDPVFSAKALGVLLSDDDIPDPVVFWHTGGTANALAYLTKTGKAEAMAP
jgi:D-cysteine desulfhydrase